MAVLHHKRHIQVLVADVNFQKKSKLPSSLVDYAVVLPLCCKLRMRVVHSGNRLMMPHCNVIIMTASYFLPPPPGFLDWTRWMQQAMYDKRVLVVEISEDASCSRDKYQSKSYLKVTSLRLSHLPPVSRLRSLWRLTCTRIHTFAVIVLRKREDNMIVSLDLFHSAATSGTETNWLMRNDF